MIKDIKKVPDDFSGMAVASHPNKHGFKQYWVFGNGYYYAWGNPDKYVYHRGHRVGRFKEVKQK